MRQQGLYTSCAELFPPLVVQVPEQLVDRTLVLPRLYPGRTPGSNRVVPGSYPGCTLVLPGLFPRIVPRLYPRGSKAESRSLPGRPPFLSPAIPPFPAPSRLGNRTAFDNFYERLIGTSFVCTLNMLHVKRGIWSNIQNANTPSQIKKNPHILML